CELEQLGDHAHALKSSAGSLGAEAMFSFCKNYPLLARFSIVCL
ncbi:Hpt domain-containing protein, partial [Psychromonas arctica]